MISVVTLSVQCYDTSAKLADTSMICAVTRSVQCYDTPASATTLLLRGQARLCLCFGTSVQYYIVPSGTYCTVSF